MMRRTALAALTLAVAVAGFAAPRAARAAADTGPVGYPRTATTDIGPAKLFVQSDETAQLSGVQVFLGGSLARQNPTKNGLAALTAQAILLTPVGGVPAETAIAAAGGTVSFAVDASAVRYYVEGRTDRVPALLGTLTTALAHPAFGNATLNAARAELAARISDQEHNPLTVGLGMFLQSYYVGGAGLPAYGNEASLTTIDGGDVQRFYDATYRRGSAAVTAVGHVTPDIASAAGALVAALPEGTAAPVSIATNALPNNPRRIVTYRDVGVPWLVVGFAAPDPGDKDFATMLVVRALVANAFEQTSATTQPAIERGIGAVYQYASKPSTFAVFVNGGEIAPPLALRELLVVFRTLSTEPLKADGLALYKKTAAGEFVTDSLTMNDRSWLIGNFAMQGVGPDYANTVLDAIAHVSAADVKRVAAKYLQKYTVAIVLPRERPAAASSR